MSTASILSILTGILANNFFQAIWLYFIVAEPKYSRKMTALIVAGTTLLYSCIALAICTLSFQMISVPIGVFLGYVAGVLLYGVMYCFLLSASHPVKSLFLFTGYFSVHTIIVIMVSILTETYALGNPLVWVLRATFNLALLVSWLFFARARMFQMYKEIRSNYGIITAISIMCYLIQTLFWFYDMEEQNRGFFSRVLLIYACCLTIAVYLIIFRYMSRSDYTNRMKQLQANEKYLQAQIDSYKKMGENARQTRHDFRHHSMVVAEYARNKDYEGILSYLQEYDQKERGKYQEEFCNNHAVDNVLSAYVSRCEQTDIMMKTDVQLAETEGVSDYDLVTIIANILENAVTGCMETEKTRRVELTIRPKGCKLVMVCRNTCVPDILFENSLPKNRERDGIGVESILSTAAKYNGIVDFSAADGFFVCQVILSNKKK